LAYLFGLFVGLVLGTVITSALAALIITARYGNPGRSEGGMATAGAPTEPARSSGG
jgi:hypothetical protein